jgi:methionyl-tRNA synthetase
LLWPRPVPGLIVPTDWSNEQLENNAAELQSLLGNFYLRITSAAIRKRLPQDLYARSRELLGESRAIENLGEVANPLQHLASVVDYHLEEFRIAEALEAIVHQLKAVSTAL